MAWSQGGLGHEVLSQNGLSQMWWGLDPWSRPPSLVCSLGGAGGHNKHGSRYRIEVQAECTLIMCDSNCEGL